MKFFDKRSMNYYCLQSIDNKSFRCGYCGDKISSDRGFKIGNHQDGSGSQVGGIYICPNCQGPTFLTIIGEQIPGPLMGSSVSNVPESLNALYEEARKCATNNCYTSSVMVCRKILMNIAVEQGASEGLKFIEYVNYLSDKGFILPNGKGWADHIRKKGNEANHEITLMDENDARDLIIFIEMLLKFIYEFPNMISS